MLSVFKVYIQEKPEKQVIKMFKWFFMGGRYIRDCYFHIYGGGRCGCGCVLQIPQVKKKKENVATTVW